jgi:hypothetical protein
MATLTARRALLRSFGIVGAQALQGREDSGRAEAAGLQCSRTRLAAKLRDTLTTGSEKQALDPAGQSIVPAEGRKGGGAVVPDQKGERGLDVEGLQAPGCVCAEERDEPERRVGDRRGMCVAKRAWSFSSNGHDGSHLADAARPAPMKPSSASESIVSTSDTALFHASMTETAHRAALEPQPRRAR